MPAPEFILAFDTSAAHCAAAVLSDGRLAALRVEDMTRGQAERLVPLLEDTLDEAGCDWRALAAIGVGTGPGNFTGIRIAVSAARGLALGLGIPAVGVSGCEARAHIADEGVQSALPAPRGMVYLCDPANPAAAPQLTPLESAHSAAGSAGLTLATSTSPHELVQATAAITATRWQTTTDPPAPLYVRAADAAPSRHTPPVILD